MALVTQQKREALAAAKARGMKLGNPNGGQLLGRAGMGGAALIEAVSANADHLAEGVGPVAEETRASGATSLRAIAAELNARGMLTWRGGQ